MIKITEKDKEEFTVKDLRAGSYNGVFKPKNDWEHSTRRIIINASLGIFHIVEMYNREYDVVSEVSNLWDDEVLVKTNDKVTIEF